MTPMATPEQTQTMVCYRHPNHETAVTCSTCGRPICTECMVFAPVGIKCPECAGTPTGAKKAAVQARSFAGAGTDFIVLLSGEVWLRVDDGGEVHLTAGDCVVQGGARHAWRNHGDVPCLMAGVLIRDAPSA